MSNLNNTEIQCVHFYSCDKSYLVPSLAMEGIFPARYLPRGQEHSYILGEMAWQDKKVMVINLSLEDRQPELSPLTQSIILKCPYEGTFFWIGCLVAQIPNSVMITENDLEFIGEQEGHLYPVKGRQLSAYLIDLNALCQSIHSGQPSVNG